MLLPVVVSLCLLTIGRTAVLNPRNQFQQQPSNSWAVEIEGGKEKANEIAEKHGLVNLGQIGSLENKYTFVRLESNIYTGSSPIQSFNTMKYDSTSLNNDPEVKLCVQQEMHRVVKRFFPPETSDDPIWQYQWNVNNNGQTNEPGLFLDINVIGAWIQGYTGNGILVAVVDDGVDSNHDDLRNNYNSANSYDYFDFDNNANPASSDDYHGTACAGEISMIRSNDKCGVGVAYDSEIAGVRILGDSLVVDSQEAGSLSHNRNNIHVYSNSWGPYDDGYTVQGPGLLLNEAFINGVDQGRNGLGSLYIWAAGNGGDNFDSCAADGYVQSPYTIPVGAYNQRGGPAYYDEKCSAKMTVAYVENTNIIDPDIQVASIITNNQCTLDFGGTSAATPYVSAIVALTLEAKPDLTWRDIQYLIVYTSNPDPLLANTDDYFTNGAGLTVSHQFGFGAIDGEAMVTRAQRWTNVPEQIQHSVNPSTDSGTTSYNDPFVSTFTYSGSIQYLEHIVINLTLNATDFVTSINYTEADEIVSEYKINAETYEESAFENYIKRGDFEVTLTSPNSIVSTVLFKRAYDIVNTDGYINWPFLSVLHWGEDPRGDWIITVTWTNPNGGSGIVAANSVMLYGVSQVPESVADIPDSCSSMCARSKGCSGPNPIDCDACNSDTIRNASSLECIEYNDCVEPYQVSDGYCYIPSSANGISGSVVFIMICFLVYHLLFIQ